MTPKSLRRLAVRIVVIGALSVAAESQAAPIAAGLLGKSIDLSWSEQHTIRRDSGVVRFTAVAYSVKLYVGTQGHIFSAFELELLGHRIRRSPGHEAEVTGAEREKLHWRFQDGALVAVWVFPQGAREVTVSFDPSFTTCSVSIQYGKAAGQAVIRMPGIHHRAEHDLLAATTASTSCAIREGNIFGDESHS